METAAALAQAHRLGRLSDRDHTSALGRLDALWAAVAVVEPDAGLVQRAAHPARTCALRRYDAVHCAGAERVGGPETVVASGDRTLLSACTDLGMATLDTSVG